MYSDRIEPFAWRQAGATMSGCAKGRPKLKNRLERLAAFDELSYGFDAQFPI